MAVASSSSVGVRALLIGPTWAGKRGLSANEGGVGVVDGEMVDEAVARKARRILAAAPAA